MFSAVRSVVSSGIKTSIRTMSTIPGVQKVVLIRENGGPEVLKYEEDYPVPKIGATDLLIKNKYAGINFIEVYFRKGIYPSEKPYVLGREAVGEVVAKGDQVDKYNVGDKVAYLSASTFAQFTKYPQNGHLIKLPKDISAEKEKIIAGSLVQGLTPLTFIDEAYNVQKGDFILVYAAAGGVGLIFDQLLKARGARTIAVASTDEKLQLAKEYGAEFLINSTKDDIVEKVKEFTNGEGVAAAFDSIGKDTFETTLQVVKRKGTIVSFGNASGAVPPFSINRLSPKNLKLVRPQLFAYVADPSEWEHYSSELIRLIDSGELKITISKVYPLKDYKEATEDLESRKTVGKLILEIPE